MHTLIGFRAKTILKDKEKLEQLLFSGVNSKLRDTITLMASGQISKGFRIGLKGKDVYYDFSDDSIVEMLKGYLNPRLNEILEGNG